MLAHLFVFVQEPFRFSEEPCRGPGRLVDLPLRGDRHAVAVALMRQVVGVMENGKKRLVRQRRSPVFSLETFDDIHMGNVAMIRMSNKANRQYMSAW